VRVEGNHEQAIAKCAEPTIDGCRRAVGEIGRQLAAVLPERPAGTGIERVAAVGIYSIVAFWVAARRRELGIRLAVGASPAGILMLVIRNGLKLTVAGIVLGLALAMVLARFIVTLLVDVEPIEPVAFGAVVLLLFAVAVAASALPAFRASQVDVVRALRW
jgi:ABC-type antimicrobial peptide transport system permease subunit